MSKHKRMIAFIVAAAIAFTMLFSVLFVAREAEHLCSGVECQVCYRIHSCIDTLGMLMKNLSIALMFFISLLCVPVLLTQKPCTIKSSPIILKVKLSN